MAALLLMVVGRESLFPLSPEVTPHTTAAGAAAVAELTASIYFLVIKNEATGHHLYRFNLYHLYLGFDIFFLFHNLFF